MARFKSVSAGDWEQPVMRGYKMACCDCGLVHTVDFRVVGGRVQLRAFRNNRSTAAMRRWMKTDTASLRQAAEEMKP